MEEIRKYDCLFNRFRKEFKDKFKKINAWSKVDEVFSISPAAAEKKFRNVRTAYGRYLKRRKSVPSGSGRDATPFHANLYISNGFLCISNTEQQFLMYHDHRLKIADSVVTDYCDHLRSSASNVFVAAAVVASLSQCYLTVILLGLAGYELIYI